MTAVVLDGEVPVSGHREDDFRQRLFQLRILVPEFMSRIDREPGNHASYRSEEHERPPAQVLRQYIECADQERDDMQRHHDVSKAPIIVILLELHDHLFGRVVGVLADQPVE